MKSTIKTAVKPTSLYSVSAIHLYSAHARINNVCTRDFLCVLLSLESNFFDRKTTSRKEIYCKFFPGSYKKNRGEIIKKVSNRISQTVKLRIICNSLEGMFILFLH